MKPKPLPPSDPHGTAISLMREADLCVKCGLCLPHCPTYQLNGSEAESPRGRITLIQGMASGLIPETIQAAKHLDNCLHCRACETVCPAKVPYTRLINRGLGRLNTTPLRSIEQARRLAWILAHPWLREAAFKLARTGARGILWITRHFRSKIQSPTHRYWRSLIQVVAETPKPALSKRAESHEPRQKLQLFAGCTGTNLDAQTLTDMDRLLSAAGYEIQVMHQPSCCGALALHSGSERLAQQLASATQIALAEQDTPIVSLASGCSTGLYEANEQVENPSATASRSQLNQRLKDWTQTLSDAEQRGWQPQFRPLRATVTLHRPCTQRNAPVSSQRGHQAIRAWLERIPDLTVREVDAPMGCCGAAGSHFLTHIDESERLLEPLLAAIGRQAPSLVASTNIGCRLQIRAGLLRTDEPLEVLHPISLLARQLQ